MNKINKGLIVFVIGVICISGLMSNTLVQASTSKRNTEMNISTKKEKIYIGQKCKLKINKGAAIGNSKSVKWKSSDKEIAIVNQSGTVTGISEGIATITAISKSDSKIRCSYEIKVQKFSNKKLNYKPIIIQNDSEQKLGYSANKYIRKKMKDQNLIITTYSELQKLKILIKKNYDYPEPVLKRLKKYNRKFFRSKSLYYTNAAVIIPSKFEIIKVEKEMIKGKVVCSITVNDIYTPPSTSGPTTDIRGKSANNEYIVELKKKDIKNVERFRLIHRHITK